jgi:predicted dithiol-disulfide oxidoreductase (DUF899 family)
VALKKEGGDVGSSERTATVTSPVKSAPFSNHNQATLAQMKTLTRQMQTLTAELERMPKLRIWNMIQDLSAAVQEMLESDVTPKQR